MLTADTNTPTYVYPLLDDPNFNQKIANKKEFQDNKFNGVVEPIEKRAAVLERMPFELASHQLFVKSFMSFQTPYNSMLLYHGLGTGKTCSAIGIAEDMRHYLKKFQINKSIIIVASPNVQNNFRLQLFDETKLVEKNGEWHFNGCVGDSIIHEINPTRLKNYPKEKVIQQINLVIKKHYTFLGYIQFSNIIEKLSENINKLKKEFNGRLVIIDEYHNMRTAFDAEDRRTKKKKTTKQLDVLVDNADNLRLLLLSATPTYNSYKEIIWTLNLLNKNDKRPPISAKDIFETNGDFKPDGKERLMAAARGYVSFVKGDNPYVFPFRIYPNPHTVKVPTTQLNGVDIPEDERLDILREHLTCVKIKKSQYTIYKRVLENTIGQSANFRDLSGFKYTELQLPIQCLNVAYPVPDGEEDTADSNPATYVGSEGLSRIMSHRNTKAFKDRFEYKEGYAGFFNLSTIEQYSCKISSICNTIRQSEGVILIYSNYLDGGLVPMALALEELGMHRYNKDGNDRNLFARPPTPFNGQQYVMITGDGRLSPNNVDDVAAATSITNVNGSVVKVIMITSAGAEGIDLKFIRQVHILEPWYNLNRIEQIIGRAVRNFSHKNLPFEKRNVQIFLYGTLLRKKNANTEAIDMYVYRKAEQKAIQMGRITRVLKEGAVDCLLNYEQQNYTHKHLEKEGLGYVAQKPAYGPVIEHYPVGDMPYSANCDYMRKCEYACAPYTKSSEYKKALRKEEATYNETFIKMNTNALQNKIEGLFKRGYIYNYEKLYKELTKGRTYNDTQVYYALSNLIDQRIPIYDKYDRPGYLVNVGEYYLFQPKELSNIHIDLYERRNPLMYKRPKLRIDLNKKYLKEAEIPEEIAKERRMSAESERENASISPISKLLEAGIYTRISNYYDKPDMPPKDEDAHDLSRFLGQSASILGNLGEYFNVPKEQIIELAVHCAIDTFSYDQKVDLMRDHFHNRFKGSLKKIVNNYFAELIKTVGDFRVAILYQYNPLKKTMELSPKIIGENNMIEPGVGYDQEVAIKSYIKRYQDATKKRLHTPLGYIAYDEKKNGCFFKIIELDKKRSVGRFCYQKTKIDLTGGVDKHQNKIVGDFERILPEDILEMLGGHPFYKKMKKEQLCALLMLTLKVINNREPYLTQVWYLTLEEHQAIFGKEE
jgi:hypothetical protein